jgi:hypothetical protein
MFLWRAFNEVCHGRPAQGGPVPPSEIDAWQRLTGAHLSEWEIETIFDLDRLAMRIHAEKTATPAT